MQIVDHYIVLLFCFLMVSTEYGMLILNDCVPVDCRLFDQICLTVIHHQVEALHILLLPTLSRRIESIYIYTLLVYKSVCLFVSNRRQNGWTDQDQTLCGTSREPGKFYKWSKFQKFVFFSFCKILKVREKILWKS